MASAFLDKEPQPTPEQILQVLGAKRMLWEQIAAFMGAQYDLPGEFKYFGKNSGWDVWFRKAGRTLVQLTPQSGKFTALVVLGGAEAARANELSLGKKVRKIFDAARPLHDGRWLFIPVTTARDVKDILHLVQIKRPLKHKQQ
ncbi:MAG: DUF3788 domain-containing protein [Chloroflexi bacterium]|nr:DUF3788 domain-containing protein [Chloroflexota bacterium]